MLLPLFNSKSGSAPSSFPTIRLWRKTTNVEVLVGSATPILPGKNSRSVAAYAPGGGSRSFIFEGVFAGRETGGGSREQIYGSSRYGSGYPYGANSPSVAGRPFPFHFWPVYMYPDYYGCDEYGPGYNSSRPGGVLTTASIKTSSPVYNTSDVFHIVGDQLSVDAVLGALVSKCAVDEATPMWFDPPRSNATRPEQVVQYYRASSFALALDNYNNTLALPINALSIDDSGMNDTPLPTTTNMKFMQCVNSTIAAAVPLETFPSRFDPRIIAGIVVPLVPVFLIAGMMYYDRRCRRRRCW